MLRTILLLVISFLILSQSTLIGQTNQLPIYKDAEAYEVYSAILSSFEVNWKSRNFIIRQETITNFGTFLNTEPAASSLCLPRNAESDKVFGTAISDFIKVNKTKWKLQAKFKLEIPYQLVSFEKILTLTRAENGMPTTEVWPEFRKKYPNSGGFMDLSAVGFNADKTVAIVSKARRCGDVCGQGDYYVLQKKDGKWIPIKGIIIPCSWTS